MEKMNELVTYIKGQVLRHSLSQIATEATQQSRQENLTASAAIGFEELNSGLHFHQAIKLMNPFHSSLKKP